MSDLLPFLKLLAKVGYPNENLKSYADMASYDLENFLPDLVDELGEEKADEFVERAIRKMSTSEGIKMQDQDDPEQYAYIHLLNPHIDLDNDQESVLSMWSWGDTHIFFRDDDGNESYKTIREISDSVGMGDWADFDEMVDEIREECNKSVYKNCGFGIWWDDQRDMTNNV